MQQTNHSGWLQLDTGEEIEFEDRFLSGINHGTEVRINGNPVPDGRYKTEKDNLILYIRNSMVYRLFKTTTFSTDRGDISFHEVANREIPIHKKMKVWSGENLVADGRYNFNANDRNLKFIDVQNGLVSKVKHELDSDAKVILALLIVGILTLVIFMIYAAVHR